METFTPILLLLMAIWFWGSVLITTVVTILFDRLPDGGYEWGLVASWPILVLAFIIDLIKGKV